MNTEVQRLINQKDYIQNKERYKKSAKRRIDFLKADPEQHLILKERFKKYAQKGDRKWQRKYRLKKLGISLTEFEYNQLLKIQDGKCYVCQKLKPLKLDHNHITKQVRKFLCHNCNVALGHVLENVTILQGLIGYLKEHSS